MDKEIVLQRYPSAKLYDPYKECFVVAKALEERAKKRLLYEIWVEYPDESWGVIGVGNTEAKAWSDAKNHQA